MPLRALTNFDKGLNTDVVAMEGALERMRDVCVGRSGELKTRGYVAGELAALTTPAGHYTAGIADCAFHPNFGTAVIRGVASLGTKNLTNADRFQLLGAALQSSAVLADAIPDLTFGYASQGANGDTIRLDHNVKTTPFEQCHQHAILPNEIVFAGVLGTLFKWGGATRPDWVAGLVSTVAGSRVLTGNNPATTLWAANVEEGMYIMIDGIGEKANGEQRAFRITYVQDNDTIEVDYPLPITTGPTNYRIVSAAAVQSPTGIWNPDKNRPTSVGICCYHQGRLFVAGTSDNETDFSTVFNFDRIRWSANAADTMVDVATETGFHHVDLWRPLAYEDIAPGHGGAIRGLVSMGDELVIIKSHAVFRMTGEPRLSGKTSNLNVKVSLIADGVGANGLKAWAMTKRGLVVASRDGLYLYDGQGVKALTDGRVSKWWRAHFMGANLAVVAYDDKLIVSKWEPTLNNNMSSEDYFGNEHLVWEIERDYFFTMTGSKVSCGVSLYTAQDQYVGDLIFPQFHQVQSGMYYYYATKVLDNPDIGGTDANYWGIQSNAPNPYIVTTAIPAGDGPLSEGRINNLYVDAYASYSIDIGIIHGSIRQWVWGNPNTGDLEYDVPAGVGDYKNRIARISVDGCPEAPAHKVYLGNDSTSSPFGYFTLFGIGADMKSTFTPGPTV